MNGLDEGLRALAADDPAKSLEGLEAGVWVEVRRRPVAAKTVAVAASFSLALALGVGAFVGQVRTPVPARAEVAVFDVNASLAPSSLLGVRR